MGWEPDQQLLNTYMDLWRSKIMLVISLHCCSIDLCRGLFWVSSKIRRRCLLRLNAKRSQIYNGKHTLCFATAVMKYRLTYSVNKYPTSELSAMLHRDIWSQWANLVVAGQGTTDAGNKGSPRSHQQTISSAFFIVDLNKSISKQRLGSKWHTSWIYHL